jgi:hypothetical protein
MADPDSQPQATTCQTNADVGACDTSSDVAVDPDAVVQPDSGVDIGMQQQAAPADQTPPQAPITRSIGPATTVQPPFGPVDVPAPASETVAPRNPPSYQHLPPGPASRWP